tara:strand:- start:255 stop:386 length:132 start_codon:yes stop_codon:yes gene_type:complete
MNYMEMNDEKIKNTIIQKGIRYCFLEKGNKFKKNSKTHKSKKE